MKVGQRFRFKSTSDAARYWKILHDAQGTVIFLSTFSEQSRRAGPIGCVLHTPTSDLGRGG